MMKRILLAASLLAVLMAATAANAASVAVTRPVSGLTVHGMVTFEARANGVPQGGGVEFRLNGRPVAATVTVQPYQVPWHSGLVFDGQHQVTAVVLDADGNVIAESSPVRFQVKNGSGTLVQISPDPNANISGDFNWQVQAYRPITQEELEDKKQRGDTLYKVTEALMFFIDGKQVNHLWGTSTGSFDFDTTKLANGPHELLVTAWGHCKGIPPFGMKQTSINVDNGHAIRRVQPVWQDIFLAPGKSQKLGLQLVFTDGQVEPYEAAIEYAAADPKVATVDANGTVTAVAPGVTSVTMTAANHKASTRVVVSTLTGLPHFTKSGQMVTRYDPDQSIFVRSLFNLSGSELQSTPGLTEATHAAAINALTTGFYSNPADNHQSTLEGWLKGWPSWWEHASKYAIDNGFSLVITGDDIARTTSELHNSVTNPWAKDAIQTAFKAARDSKHVICVEMIDEASFLWGGTPKPNDGRWMKRDPAVPDDAFIKLRAIIDGVENHPPISWPVGGISGPDVAANWMGDPEIADYTSHYWDVLAWRRAYPDGSASLPQMQDALNRAVVDRYPLVQRDKPMLLLTSLCGNWYIKPEPGQPLTPDEYLYQAWNRPPVSSSVPIMYGAIMGGAGIRTYAYDGMWQRNRDRGKPGRYQIGGSPFGGGNDRWQALSTSFNLIKRLEPYLLQKRISSVEVGPDFVTGAREGDGSRLLMALSMSESQEKVSVNLQPYMYDGAESIVRFRAVGASLQMDTIAAAAADSLTVKPGEAVFWLFLPKTNADNVLPSVAFAKPLADSVVTGTVAIAANAADNQGVDRVVFSVDGRQVAVDEQAPYQCSWDTAGEQAGVWHSVSAVAYDAAGNASEARMALRVLEK